MHFLITQKKLQSYYYYYEKNTKNKINFVSIINTWIHINKIGFVLPSDRYGIYDWIMVAITSITIDGINFIA